EALDEIGYVKLVQAWNRPQRRALRIDAVDAAFIVAGAEVRTRLELFGEILGMFDDAAIDVGNVQGAVRAGLEHRRPEPVVARAEKFAALFVRRPMAGEGDAVGFENFTMDDVLRRFAD